MCHFGKTPLLSGNHFTRQLDGFNRIGAEAVCSDFIGKSLIDRRTADDYL
jgi:hypothetical protein